MKPGILLERLAQRLEAEAPEVRAWVLRELLDRYPIPALTGAQRMKRLRHRRSDESVTDDVTSASPPVKRQRHAMSDERVTSTPLRLPSLSFPSISPVVSEETTAVKKQEYPAELQEIPELLRKLRAPAEFDDAAFWIRVDAWLGSEHSGVGYLDELPKYLAWVSVQNGSERHRNLRRGFRNWLAKSEYWSQKHAQTEALRRRR